MRTSGWLGSTEVVELEYDPKRVSYAALVKHARKSRAASSVFTRNDAEAKTAREVFPKSTRPFQGKIRVVQDTRYYARRTALKHVPLTRGQLTRANAYLRGRRMRDLLKRDILSPGQKALIARIGREPKRAWPTVFEKDVDVAHWTLRRFLSQRSD